MNDRHKQIPYPLRMQDGLRPQVEAEMQKSGLSMNAEINRLIAEALAARHGMPSAPTEPIEILMRRIVREELELFKPSITKPA